MDETRTERDATATSPGATDTGRAGYCQECGRSLTPDSLRRVGNGVFCETCATLRQSTAGWQNVHAGATYNGAGRVGAVPPLRSDDPNPRAAGVLGLIPGVGAIFNGQYAKGAMHLIVFVILMALADNVYWGFWWFVWGWIFYQAFDAYHTARARRDHLPLPNPFGWNDIGERVGFTRPGQTPVPPFAASEPFAQQRAGANWAGYVPPRDPGSVPYSPFSSSAGDSENPYSAPFASPVRPPTPPGQPVPHVPYVPTYTGVTPGPPVLSQTLPLRPRLVPSGAIWLIGLGVLFLMGNLLPEWRLSGRWFVPLLLGAAAIWSAIRRLDMARRAQNASASLAAALVGPAMLLAVAVLLAMQAATVIPLRRSWPVLLVVWGMMLLLERSAGTHIPYMAPERAEAVPPPPVRSTSGTGSLGL